MKVTHEFKHDPVQGRYIVYTVHCDCCSEESLSYEGKEEDAKLKIRLQVGWTIGNTGIVRGPICSQSYAHHLYKALHESVTRW